MHCVLVAVCWPTETKHILSFVKAKVLFLSLCPPLWETEAVHNWLDNADSFATISVTLDLFQAADISNLQLAHSLFLNHPFSRSYLSSAATVWLYFCSGFCSTLYFVSFCLPLLIFSSDFSGVLRKAYKGIASYGLAFKLFKGQGCCTALMSHTCACKKVSKTNQPYSLFLPFSFLISICELLIP